VVKERDGWLNRWVGGYKRDGSLSRGVGAWPREGWVAKKWVC
jgi:hypothetical protein